jgi:hypothetical protein
LWEVRRFLGFIALVVRYGIPWATSLARLVTTALGVGLTSIGASVLAGEWALGVLLLGGALLAVVVIGSYRAWDKAEKDLAVERERVRTLEPKSELHRELLDRIAQGYDIVEDLRSTLDREARTQCAEMDLWYRKVESALVQASRMTWLQQLGQPPSEISRDACLHYMEDALRMIEGWTDGLASRASV